MTTTWKAYLWVCPPARAEQNDKRLEWDVTAPYAADAAHIIAVELGCSIYLPMREEVLDSVWSVGLSGYGQRLWLYREGRAQ